MTRREPLILDPHQTEPRPMTGWVIWPEGIPDRAVYRTTRFSRWWTVNGPYAIGAALMGRGIRTAWPVAHSENPIVVARRCESRIA